MRTGFSSCCLSMGQRLYGIGFAENDYIMGSLLYVRNNVRRNTLEFAEMSKLDEIEKLLQEITPGPWEWHEGMGEIFGYRPFTDGSKGKGFRETIVETDGKIYPPKGADREFIVAAPEIVRKLLAVARAAEEFCIESASDDFPKSWSTCYADLREAIEAVKE